MHQYFKKPKMNRYERANFTSEKKKDALKGDGVFIYRNSTSGDLSVAKPVKVNGQYTKIVPKGQTFESDSYFMSLVKSPSMTGVSFVEEVKTQSEPKVIEESVMHDEKLILDQPPTVTVNGTVEHVVKSNSKKKTHKEHNVPSAKDLDVLLTEEPLDGVDIITG